MLSRVTCILTLALLLTSCAPILNLTNSVFDFCPSSTDTSDQHFGSPDADDLVIFIHGLCGDAKTTWTNPTTHFVFPEQLALDFAKENQAAYVVVFDYVSRLQGGPSILSIADHLEFEIGELLKKHSYRTLRIVAHSMGGLVAREYILHRHPQLRVTNVVLLATPSNGAELAELRRLIPEHRQIEELRHIDKGNTYLESLNKDWNREFKGAAHPRHILTFSAYEELAMPVVGPIVRLSSAITYADDSTGFQENHVSIAKPKERNRLYRWVKAKLEESLKKNLEQLVDGIVKQGLYPVADVPQRLPRSIEPLEGLQTSAGAQLQKVSTYVKAGQLQEALVLLTEKETEDNQLIKNIAQRRFAQGEIYELLFQVTQSVSYYSQAVQLAPWNAFYRNRYGEVLLHTGEVRAAILQFEEAVRLSRASHDMPIIQGNALGGLGMAYKDLGEPAKAIKFQEQALAIYRGAGDVHGEGNALWSLGATYANLGQYTKAIELDEQALAIYRKAGDVHGEGNALRSLGATYANLAQYPKATEFQKQALEIYRNAGDVHGEGNALGNLGATYYNLGQYPKAIEFQEQALAIQRKVGSVRGEGIELGGLGAIYNSLGQYSKAIEYLEQALAIHRKVGDVLSEANALGSLGDTYNGLGQYLKAIEFQEQALAIYRNAGDVDGKGAALGSLGITYIKLKKHTKAIEYLEQALATYRKLGDVHNEGNALGNLGVAHNSLGEYPKAVEYLEQALAIYRKVGDVHGEGNALGNLGATYINLGQYPKAMEFLKASQVIFEDSLRIAFPFKTELRKLKNEQRD